MNLLAKLLPDRKRHARPRRRQQEARVRAGRAAVREQRRASRRSQVFDSLFARENLGSTGLGQGIAIPHGRIKGLKEAVGAFVRTEAPIPFDAPDGQPVH